jgi:hypothetical protein
MGNFARHALVLAGVVTLSIGLWLGFPLRRAVNQQRSEDFIRGWRVAHSSIIVGGIMLLALVPALPLLALPRPLEALVVGFLAISTGAFCFALILGAMHEHRGLQKTPGALAHDSGRLCTATPGTWLLYVSLTEDRTNGVLRRSIH